MAKKLFLTTIAAAMMLLVATSGHPVDLQGANRPELQAIIQTASEKLATTKASGNAKTENYAPVLLFEERHDLRAVQIQEAIAMSRLHERFAMKDIALEGYLQDESPIDTHWAEKAAGTETPLERAKVIVSLLKEGEISSVEFMKLVYDDIEIHPVELRKDYEVTASQKAESAIFAYLAAIAQNAFPRSRYGELQTIENKLQSLPKDSPAAKAESKKFIDTLMSGDPWVKSKYDIISDPKQSQMLTGEDQLAMAEEIERRAASSNVTIQGEDKSGMQEYINFWRGRMNASQTMVEAITSISKNTDVRLVSGVIGAFHTSGMARRFNDLGMAYAILRPLAMDDEKRAGSIGNDAFERKYNRQSVFTDGFSKQLMSSFTSRKKKPQHVLATEWFQAKSETYLMTDRIARRLLGAGGPPPSGENPDARSILTSTGNGGKLPPGPPIKNPPWGFADDDLSGKRIKIDPRLITIVAAAPGSKRRAILFPMIVNPDDPARRKQLWVKAALTQEVEDRKSVEDILSDALRDVTNETSEPRIKAEDKFGRIQITSDVHAAISETRAGAMSVALGV